LSKKYGLSLCRLAQKACGEARGVKTRRPHEGRI